jgi:surface antigen
MRLVMCGLAVGATLFAGAAGAAGFGFLSDTPLARFDAEDLRLMNGAIEQALSSPATGSPVRWANERTASSGEVTAQRDFDRQGRPCRDLRVVNRHRRLESAGVFTLCRDNGQWTLAP